MAWSIEDYVRRAEQIHDLTERRIVETIETRYQGAVEAFKALEQQDEEADEVTRITEDVRQQVVEAAKDLEKTL